jgi:hypothetical protein
MHGMGCALYIRCALSIHKKVCRKSLGCALYIGARYIPENTVIYLIIWPKHVAHLRSHMYTKPLINEPQQVNHIIWRKHSYNYVNTL